MVAPNGSIAESRDPALPETLKAAITRPARQSPVATGEIHAKELPNGRAGPRIALVARPKDPRGPAARDRRDRLAGAMRHAQEEQLRRLGSDLEGERAAQDAETRSRAAVTALTQHLIPTFLRVIERAGNPGYDRSAKAWPIAVETRSYAIATIPGWIVALDRQGRLWHAGKHEPQEPYDDISNGRGSRVSKDALWLPQYRPIGGFTHKNPDYSCYIDDAFEKSIGWYLARFPEMTWPGLELPED